MTNAPVLLQPAAEKTASSTVTASSKQASACAEMGEPLRKYDWNLK
jgi:hypothetical protein